MRHQSRKCGDNRDRFSLKKLAQNSHPLLNQLITVNVCLIKDQVLGRKIIGFSTIQLAIIQQLLRLHITVCHDQLHIILFRKSIYHMKLLGIHTAADTDLALLCIQLFLNILIFPQLSKGRQYCIHTNVPAFSHYSAFLLYWFMAASTSPSSISSTAPQTFSRLSFIIASSSPEKCPST